MCVNEQHVKMLGDEALDMIKNGIKPGSSFGKILIKSNFIILIWDFFLI